jgi:hypothetical protein
MHRRRRQTTRTRIIWFWARYADECACGDQACKQPGKHPIGRLVPNGFKGATTDEKTIRGWWHEYPDAGIGLPTGAQSGIDVLDIDFKNGKNGALSLSSLLGELGALPETVSASTSSGGKHRYFRHVQGTRCSPDKLGAGLDVRGEGGFVVLPPSHGLYNWIGTDEPDQIAEWPTAWIKHLGALNACSGSLGAGAEADPKLVAAALAVIPNPPSLGWHDWKRIGMAVWRATGGSDAGFRTFDKWSQKWVDYDAERTRKAWREITDSPPNIIGAGTLFYHADEASPGWRDQVGDPKHGRTKPTQSDLLIELAEDAGLFHTDLPWHLRWRGTIFARSCSFSRNPNYFDSNNSRSNSWGDSSCGVVRQATVAHVEAIDGPMTE